MKFYCVKDRVTVEVPEGQYKEYVPSDPVKLAKFNKAGRIGYTATHSCGFSATIRESLVSPC